jgi:hypothetical protein
MLWSRDVVKAPLKLTVGYFSFRGKAMEKSERKARTTRCWFWEKEGGKDP